MKECKLCGNTSDDACTVCPSCGAKFAKDASVHETCVGCGREMDTTADACPYCGEPYTHAKATPADEKALAEDEKPYEATSILGKSAVGKKLERGERKNHFMANGVVALFSLVVFVLLFFAGAEVVPLSMPSGVFGAPLSLETYLGAREGYSQSTIDLVLGGVSLLTIDENKMEAYLDTTFEQFNAAYAEACEKYGEEIAKVHAIKDAAKQKKEAKKLRKKLFSYAATRSDLNIVKVNYYSARVGRLSSGERLRAEAGAVGAALLGVLLLASLVATLIFGGIAVYALIGRRATAKPYRAFTVPVTLLLAAYALSNLNPIAGANGALTAAAVLPAVGAVLLCACKRFLLDDAQTLSRKSLVRGSVSWLTALLAVFLLSGTLLTVKVVGLTAKGTVGVLVGEYVGSVLQRGDAATAFGVALNSSSTMTLPYGIITWIVATALSVRCVTAACADLYTGKDEAETRKGKSSTMGYSVSAAVVTVVSLVLFLLAFSRANPGIGAPYIFAVLCLIASAAVKYICAERPHDGEK